MLQELGHKVHLAHTHKVRLIAESRMKTDKIDAKILADLLRVDFLPKTYLATKELRDHRNYCRYRISLARQRARLKIQIRRVLRLDNRIPPKSCKTLFGKASRMWLKQLELGPIHQRIKEETLSLMDVYDEQIKKLDKEIKDKNQNTEQANQLKSIPGIGDLIAQVILAEVGKITRFDSPKKFASYCGLAPSQRSSADKQRFGKITKQGNSQLRWL